MVRLLKAMTAGVLKYSHRSAQPMQLEFVKRSLELGLTMVGVVFISGCVFYELELVRGGAALALRARGVGRGRGADVALTMPVSNKRHRGAAASS